MVNTLQKKFIFAAMLAVTILLVTLVAAISLLNAFSVTDRQGRILEMLCGMEEGAVQGADAGPTAGGASFGEETAGEDPVPGQGSGEAPDGSTAREGRDPAGKDPRDRDAKRDRLQPYGAGGLFGRRFSMDDALARRFFCVRMDEDGGNLRADTSQIYAVTEEEALAIAGKILSTGRAEGRYEGFRYRLCERESGEKALFVMDVSGDTADILSVLGISALIAALCWLAMLLPVHALARRAIAPTAMSIERQKQFITNAGHELKTPLAVIQANAEALELFEGESKWTRNIRAQTDRLSALMQNLLTLARMDENALQLDRKAFSLDALALEAWEAFAQSAQGKGIGAELPGGDGGPAPVQAFADRESVAQLLSILFDNAVKYTPAGGSIRVRLAQEAGAALLEQSNTVHIPKDPGAAGAGDGLPADPERLFERFYRADADRSRKKGGYGIGLSAARAIAGANGGTITARVRGDRIFFTVRLPASERG